METAKHDIPRNSRCNGRTMGVDMDTNRVCKICGKPWIEKDIIGIKAPCADCSCESNAWERYRVKKAIAEGKTAPSVAPGVMDDDEPVDPQEDLGYRKF